MTSLFGRKCSSTLGRIHAWILLRSSSCLLFRPDRAGVVVNDFPAVRKLLPHQREHSPDVAALALQVPLAKNECCIRAQKTKFQIGEIQLAHRGVIRIAFLVSRQHAIPAARYAVASGECESRRAPIPNQKSVHVSAVPRGLLRAKHAVNFFCVGVPSLVQSSKQTSATEQDQYRSKSNRQKN